MIPGKQEIAYALFGSYLLARMDRNGIHFFNLTEEGFWRSFFAAVIVAPGYLLILLLTSDQSPGALLEPPVLFVEVLRYIVSWIAFPIIMIPISRFLNVSHNFATMVIAYNWCQVLLMGLSLAVVGLAHSGLVSEVIANFVSFAFFCAILVYLCFILHATLEVGWYSAAALTAIELLIAIAIQSVLLSETVS